MPLGFLLVLLIPILTAALIYGLPRLPRRSRPSVAEPSAGRKGEPDLKLFALSNALTLVAFSACWFGGVIIEEATDEDGLPWATFTVTLTFAICLLSLGALSILAKMSVFWVALGAVAGFVLSPVIVFTFFAITYEIWEWPKSLEMD